MEKLKSAELAVDPDLISKTVLKIYSGEVDVLLPDIEYPDTYNYLVNKVPFMGRKT